DALEMPVVIVPHRAGVFSAVGILGAPMQADLVETWPDPLDHTGLDEALDRLRARTIAHLSSRCPTPGSDAAEGADRSAGADASRVETRVELDCRYAGQSHELRVPSVGAFPAEHERRNG